MVLDAEVTMDDLHSEAVVEAVAGSEAEATTEGEDAVRAADTRMEEGEAACILLSLSSLSLRIQYFSTAFFQFPNVHDLFLVCHIFTFNTIVCAQAW
jgi:glycerol-3-phosphate O-acyltransferase